MKVNLRADFLSFNSTAKPVMYCSDGSRKIYQALLVLECEQSTPVSPHNPTFASAGADTHDAGPLLAGSSGRQQKSRKRKRISSAQLFKRTFKIDVLNCDKCGGRMKLMGVVFDQPTITTTLRALGLPGRAPPIAPARSRQLQGCSNDWTEADVGCGWPD